MAEEFDPFPLWDEPATKGDVLQAMVFARSTFSAIMRAFLAAQRGDQKAVHAEIDAWAKADKVFGELVNTIGGKANG